MQDESTTRLERLNKLRQQGVNPYPSKVQRTHTIEEILNSFQSLKVAPAIITGRVMAIRGHGGSTFIDLQDGTARMQTYAKKDDVGADAYEQLLQTLDVGDFLEMQGTAFMTKMGEPTLRLQRVKIIAKALEPLPDKWHGLQDIEARYRKRYLDLIMSDESRAVALMRMRITRALRAFFDARGFLEVETPMLQPLAGGATARPFITHHNALDADFYLRIAPELYLKRLIVGGFEKVYEIGKCFRNEGIDREHNPEFTMMEFYWAYADYQDLMRLTEEMFGYLIQEVKGGKELTIGSETIAGTAPFPRLTFQEAIEQRAGMTGAFAMNESELANAARRHGVAIETGWGRGRIFDEAWKHLVRPTIKAPTFLIDHPLELSPLAKKKADNPLLVERFQLIINGFEVVNAFSELNDPLDQEERFRAQEKARDAGDDEAQRFDEDFVTALKHGMPPTAGWGMGIDRLASLFANVHNLKEVILFPTLRPKPAEEHTEGEVEVSSASNTARQGRPNDEPITHADVSVPFPRDRALALLREHVKNENLIKHMFAVEAVMRALAKKFNGNPDLWGLAGLLHDIDWEETQNDFVQHSLKSAAYLTAEGMNPEVVQAVKVHNHTHGFPLTTMMEKALFCAEELTGIITACALVMPSKQLNDVAVESIIKKFKQPSFAKGVNREVILRCEELLGMKLEELAELELQAMKNISKVLGL